MAEAAECDATEALFNECPVSGIRYCFCWKTRWRSRPGLPGAVNTVFEAGQLFGADRAAGMEFTGGNADLGAEAEFAAVSELGRGVMKHDRRIDLVEKFARGAFVVGHDRVGVMRAVIVDMG